MYSIVAQKWLHVTGIPRSVPVPHGSGVKARMEEFLMSETVINNIGMAIGIIVISVLMLVAIIL
jgi:hypothetical protein